MATQKAACSDQSPPGEPIAKRAKPVRVTETSTTTVQSTMACSGEHKIIESPEVEVSELNECVDEQHAEVIETLVQNTVRKLKNRIVVGGQSEEVETVKSTIKLPH